MGNEDLNSLEAARRDVERRFAYVLGCDPGTFRKPGLHYVDVTDPSARAWMGFAVHFLAILPLEAPEAVVVGGPPALRERLPALTTTAAKPDLPDALLKLASTVHCDDTYLCEVLVGDPASLRLDGDTEKVTRFDVGSRDVRDWDGTAPADEVNGPLFVTTDSDGLTAWAGVKQVSPWAQDIQVATRPDARLRGLARAVASAAVRHIVAEGVTPYYAHFADNDASAALARSLGFQPWGRAIFAESRIPH